MVGRYGIVSEDGFEPLLDSEKADLKMVFDFLKEERIELLPKLLLEKSIPLKLEDKEETTVFNALFSPAEEIPWRRSSK